MLGYADGGKSRGGVEFYGYADGVFEQVDCDD